MIVVPIDIGVPGMSFAITSGNTELVGFDVVSLVDCPPVKLTFTVPVALSKLISCTRSACNVTR